tara:strand:+ start:2661 stop:3059 length:399 start_codon:yes stop_codon:yes gene_type:complete
MPRAKTLSATEKTDIVENTTETGFDKYKYDEQVAVPATDGRATKRVKLDLEVDASAKDLGINPYAKWIHLAHAVDSWRIFPRIFILTYIILLHKSVLWYMDLANPTLEQSGLISIVVGAGAAWFGLYTGSKR